MQMTGLHSEHRKTHMPVLSDSAGSGHMRENTRHIHFPCYDMITYFILTINIMGGYRKRLSIVDNFLLLHRLHKLIKIEHTGSIDDLCNIFNMPRTNVMRRIEQLREMGAQIEFDTLHNTYVYTNHFEFEVTIKSS